MPLFQRWFTCRHEFSWPRHLREDLYYQVCLRCGVMYRYDWASMRRTEKMRGDVEGEGKRPPCNTRPGWVPRERRLRWLVPVQYRVRGEEAWQEGTAENISRSGLLFVSRSPLPVNAAIEVVLEMPTEIAGREQMRVVCSARVARVAENDREVAIGARIDGYEVIEARAAV